MHAAFLLLFDGPYPIKVLSMPFDKLMLAYVIVTAIAASAAIVTLLMIRGQLIAMRRQLGQMEAAGKQTDSLIAQATIQANALLIAARAAESSAEAAHAQLVEFRTAAEAAAKSAEAALMNAEALINSERPWVFVQFQISQDNARPLSGLLLLPAHFTFHMNNSGRTPAELLYWYANYSIVAAREVDDFKLNEHLLGSDFIHKRILEPGGSIPVFYRFDISSPAFSDDEYRAIATSQLRLMFFGLIRYRDTLGDADAPIRESQYCYWYDTTTRNLVMGGQPGANKHT